jgi:hypothetical protein
MIPMDRETLMMVAVIVCVAGLIFMFKELNKTREEMNGFKNFSAQIVQHLSNPVQVIEDKDEDDAEVEVVKTSVEKKEE